MIISVREHGAAEAAASLSASNIRSKITAAIRQAIRAGKTEGQQLTKSRYVSDINRLGKISVRASGLRGQIKVSGARNLLKRFKINPSTRMNPQPPGGVYANVVRGQGGNILRAFIAKNGLVFERAGRSRLPIIHRTTVSLPGAWDRVGGQIEAALIRHLEKNLEGII